MVNEILYKIELLPGHIGWYDSLTGIHLSLTKKEAFVYKGYNTVNINKAIENNIIAVIRTS